MAEQRSLADWMVNPDHGDLEHECLELEIIKILV